jgi:hypothetical protein
MTWWVLTLDRPFVAVNAESDPGAATFLQVLFMNLYEVDVKLCSDRIETEDGSIQEVSGRCGTDEMGYIWTSYQDLNDRSEEYIAILTYGLPDLELQWSYSLMKSGYAYRFCHGHLRVFFQTEIVQQQLVAIWKQVFNFEPNFQKEST